MPIPSHLQLCENGELLSFVQMEGATHPVGLLMNILLDCACGMKYLASRKFVHRDLAARNVLLDENHRGKICDFGLGRQVKTENYYRMASDMMLPIRWTDPRALETQIFSEATDVGSCPTALARL